MSAPQHENLIRIDRLSERLRILPFDIDAAIRFGNIKAHLRGRGITKSDFDLAIASIALVYDATLVSEDHAFHDGAIEGLRVEDGLTDAHRYFPAAILSAIRSTTSSIERSDESMKM